LYDTVIELSTIDGIPVASIGNELDLANSDTVRRYLDEAAGTSATFVLSLEKCRYIDSSGLRPIFGLAQRLGAGFFVVAARGTQVRRVFDLTSQHRRLNICATVDEAIEKAMRGLAVA